MTARDGEADCQGAARLEPQEPAQRAELAARLRVVVARLGRQGRRSHRGGLTASQLSALVAIECHGELRVGDLASIEGTAAATMTRLVASLVDTGLVERRPDPADGRSIRVALTAAGARRLDDVRREKTTALIRAVERLSADEFTRLADAVPVLESLIEPPPGDPG